MFEHFSHASRLVLAWANIEAKRLKHTHIETSHILLGLCKRNDTAAATVFDALGCDRTVIRAEMERRLSAGKDPIAEERLPQTPNAKRAITFAMKESQLLGNNYVGTEHLLLAIFRLPESAPAEVMRTLNISYDLVLEKLAQLRSKSETSRLEQ